MPATITPVSAWTTPVETPAGSDAANAASVENAVQRLADRLEYLKDKALGGSTTWPHTDNVHASIFDYLPVYAATPHDVRVDFDAGAGDAIVIAASDSAQILYPLQKYLRNGMILSAVSYTVAPGEARATGHAIKIRLWKKAHNYLFPASETTTGVEIASAEDDFTAAQQAIVLSGLSETIDRLGYEYFLVVTFGDTATAHPDWGLALRLSYSNPGPRNT